MLEVECLSVGPFAANCYLVYGPSRRALVLDPGAEAEIITQALLGHRLTVAAYLLTHGHVDHLSALADLQARHPAPYALLEADYRWAFSAANQLPPYYPAARQPGTPPLLVRAQQNWKPAPDLAGRILAAPGHSPGGLCAYFEAEGLLFTGDTLFRDSVGRTDLPGGNPALLAASLKTLAQLPPATRIFPGHGPATTLSDELRANPFLADTG